MPKITILKPSNKWKKKSYMKVGAYKHNSSILIKERMEDRLLKRSLSPTVSSDYISPIAENEMGRIWSF